MARRPVAVPARRQRAARARRQARRAGGDPAGQPPRVHLGALRHPADRRALGAGEHLPARRDAGAHPGRLRCDGARSSTRTCARRCSRRATGCPALRHLVVARRPRRRRRRLGPRAAAGRRRRRARGRARDRHRRRRDDVHLGHDRPAQGRGRDRLRPRPAGRAARGLRRAAGRDDVHRAAAVPRQRAAGLDARLDLPRRQACARPQVHRLALLRRLPPLRGGRVQHAGRDDLDPAEAAARPGRPRPPACASCSRPAARRTAGASSSSASGCGSSSGSGWSTRPGSCSTTTGRVGSMGRSGVAGVEFRVVDDDDHPLPAGRGRRARVPPPRRAA